MEVLPLFPIDPIDKSKRILLNYSVVKNIFFYRKTMICKSITFYVHCTAEAKSMQTTSSNYKNI